MAQGYKGELKPQPEEQPEPDKGLTDLDKEIVTIEKGIRLDELKGIRDKPAILAAREVAVREREQALEANWEQLEAAKKELVTKAEVVTKKETDIDKYIKGHSHLKAEVATLIARKDEFHGLILEAISTIDFLQNSYSCYSQGNLPHNSLYEIARKIRALEES